MKTIITKNSLPTHCDRIRDAILRSLPDALAIAFSATITAQAFEHGESLSPVIAAALPELVARLEAKVREFLKF